jgi:hypothetical protein
MAVGRLRKPFGCLNTVHKGLFFCESFLERAFSSAPRDAGVERSEERGVPPLPSPRLHPMEGMCLAPQPRAGQGRGIYPAGT